ncbi:hypothetical protein NQ314_016133 [Rhamnusium bicolor]|uniref:Peptidase C1A papain C-terminal domain-containing protein n=1 Tax=Rhamnusium bicolor TaxID=1586634 RepID=A0AAV8WXM3_9CUCU|nr:hypothetical protein NQ314_016133 [Rhamnusium bicolor]
MRRLFAAVVFATALIVVLCQSDIISEDFIRTINARATTWTARRNFENYTNEQLKSLAGLKGISRDPNFTLPIVDHDFKSLAIPDSFDARVTWPKCKSIATIRDQGHCGSCWAFAAVEVMTDRLCISSGGKKQFTFSPEELVSCCSHCGNGCKGGYLYEPFKPYTAKNGKTPSCQRKCVSEYSRQYKEDLHHGITAYQVSHSVTQMQQEIMKNGPVGASMSVYQHTHGLLQGQHAIKIIGWGTEKGVPYWLVANSWGTHFGEHGFFKIRRGTNHCKIESHVAAGSPNTSE